jgi:hypothetical protein
MRAGFLLRILWCSQSDDHSQNDLAKFGYILEMKVERKTESFYILGYLLELIIKIWWFGIKFKIQKLVNFGPFFAWKILWILGQNHIFQVKICQKFASKRNTIFESVWSRSAFACVLLWRVTLEAEVITRIRGHGRWSWARPNSRNTHGPRRYMLEKINDLNLFHFPPWHTQRVSGRYPTGITGKK